jgi:hypothetical protein
MTLGGAADHFAKAVESSWDGSHQNSCSIWLDPNCAGGVKAVVATLDFPAQWAQGGLAIFEFTGGPGDLDVTSAKNDNFYPNWTSGPTAGIAGSGSLYIGAYKNADMSNVTPDAGWTIRNVAYPAAFLAAYQVSSDAAGATPQFSGTTNNQSQFNAAAIVVIKAPSGPPPPLIVAGSAASASLATAAFGLLGVITGSGSNLALGRAWVSAVLALAGTSPQATAGSGVISMTGAIAGTSLPASSATGALGMGAVFSGTATAVPRADGSAGLVAIIAGLSLTASRADAYVEMAQVLKVDGLAVAVSRAYGAMGEGMPVAGSALAVSVASGAVIIARFAKMPDKFGALVTTDAIGAMVTSTSLAADVQVLVRLTRRGTRKASTGADLSRGSGRD